MRETQKRISRLQTLVTLGLALLTAFPLPGGRAFAAGKKAKKAAAVSESAATDEEKGTSQKKYPPLLIGAGDELEIYVVNFSSGNGYTTTVSGETGMKSQLPTNYLVDSDGFILFPFLGDIQLKGLTQIEGAKLIQQKLSEYISNPQVTLLVRSSNYYNVSVLGDVAHPGQFLIRGEPTVFSILSEAGGALEDANLGGALIIHGDTNKKEEINLDRYLKDRSLQEKPPVLYPGDVLMIPKNEGLTSGDWAIIASIAASAAIIATQIK